MRINAAVLLTLVSFGAAMPAAAQTYGSGCNASKSANQLGGALIGSVVGGFLGSNVAARGHRDDGTAVGAVLGGVLGAGIGGSSVDCRGAYPLPVLPPPAGTYAPEYGYEYRRSREAYDDFPRPEDPGYSNYDRYRDDAYTSYHDDTYLDGRRAYPGRSAYAGRDCAKAMQITRLPDGRVIRRPVEACRQAYFGEWEVRD